MTYIQQQNEVLHICIILPRKSIHNIQTPYNKGSQSSVLTTAWSKGSFHYNYSHLKPQTWECVEFSFTYRRQWLICHTTEFRMKRWRERELTVFSPQHSWPVTVWSVWAYVHPTTGVRSLFVAKSLPTYTVHTTGLVALWITVTKEVILLQRSACWSFPTTRHSNTVYLDTTASSPLR